MMEDLDIKLDDIQEEDSGSEGLAGLGRGLNALFDDEETSTVIEEIEQRIQSEPESNRLRQSIGIEKLYPSPFQPRRIFSEDSIAELASSIEQYGVLQPLLVRENPTEPGNYEIIAGERRWRASQKAQLHELPIIILDLSELDAFKIALIENLQREDLDPIDEAMGYKKLLDEYDQTQEQLAKAVGKSRPHITNMVRLLNLPDTVQAHLSAGDLTMGHARALITAEDPNTLAKQVISKGLSVRQTETLAMGKKGVEQKPRSTKSTAPASSPASKSSKDPDTIALEDDMTNALGMKVTIDSTDGKSGTLAIEFKTLDQLDEVLHRLAHFPSKRLEG